MDSPQVSKPRRIHFIGCNDFADPIRGRACFDYLARTQPDVVVVHYDHVLTPDVDRCGLYIILMPSSEPVAWMVETISKKPCGCRAVVDVHADFWTPGDHVTGGRDWWERDGHIYNLERCIKAADAVTVPSVEYVESVMEMNPRVAVVPDSPDGSITEEAGLAWEQAIMIANLNRTPHSGDPRSQDHHPEAIDTSTGVRYRWSGVRWEPVDVDQ